jgi:hypothetical protein
MEQSETQKQNTGINPDQNNQGNEKQSRGGKILLIVICILIAGSVVATYWRIVVKRDYIVQAQIDCDPESENCFIWKCDPNSTEEGEACTGDADNDIWYYKLFFRNAKNIPNCDPDDEDCTAYVCDPGEKDCSEELCTPENVPEGETCNDPEQYLLENPPEEDSEECDPDDQECLDSQDQEECAPDDQECIDAQEEAPCDPGDEECIQSENEQISPEECAPDDLNCNSSDEEQSTDGYENVPASPTSTEQPQI